jgi:hypothetical protein
MKRSFTVIFLFFLIAGGCGGEAENGTDVAVEQVSEPVDPEALGNRIADEYVEMYYDLDELLSRELDTEQLWPELTDLKEEYISRFLEMGAVHEEMSDQEKAVVSSTTWSRFNRMDTKVLNSVNDAIIRYRQLDNDLANEISDFNILTQYTFWDLLREQEPEEAARLGI